MSGRNKNSSISESEFEIMKILWDSETPLTVGGVLGALLENKWKSNTVATLLNRLVDKGAVSFEKSGKVHKYYAVLKKDEYNMSETKSFLSKIYNGSVKNLVASLYENKAISQDEIDDLRKMFDLEK